MKDKFEHLSSNSDIAEQIDKLINRSKIKPEDFTEIYPEEQIQADLRYTQRAERYFSDIKNQKDAEQSYHPKALENIAEYNINQGAWLNDPEDEFYTVKARGTSRYDDILNRIDLVVTAHTEESNNYMYGLDMTTNIDEDALLYKIIYNSNDKSYNGPVGAGQIKYYEDKNENRSNVQLLPRFCVGVSQDTVDTLLEKTRLLENAEPTELNHDYTTQYKLLIELSAQTHLFMKALEPKIQNETATDDETTLYNNLMDLDDTIFSPELDRTKKLLPDWAKKYGTGEGLIRHQLVKGDHGERPDETFGNIMKVINRLSEELDDDPKALDKYLDEFRGGTPPLDNNQEAYQAKNPETTAQNFGKTGIDINKKLS